MKYLFEIIMLLVIMFISNNIISMRINGDKKFNESLKLAAMSTLITLPLLMLIGGVLFLAFKIVLIKLMVGITTFQIFTIVLFTIVIIFFCDFICRKIGLDLIAIYLSKKYKNKNLTNSEMIVLVDNKQRTVNITSVIIMFLINLLTNFIILKFLQIQFSDILVICMAIIVSITYKVFFKSNMALQRERTKN
ncbi:hypothetical protein [Clostridium frigidicarnis]|uniref:Uncharacterized protein n=1 Tax=Clostridium frigidicarnis TaxID=84698 RepID=A0A1I0YHP3_9CLOT|nr:hypothetical protein [Clostridium frigidicarnis]SFB12672.1 hypothetical protein SAMN04488528_101339 [Clostridium frigidicarnis]